MPALHFQEDHQKIFENQNTLFFVTPVKSVRPNILHRSRCTTQFIPEANPAKKARKAGQTYGAMEKEEKGNAFGGKSFAFPANMR